jgi:hypothetical protein
VKTIIVLFLCIFCWSAWDGAKTEKRNNEIAAAKSRTGAIEQQKEAADKVEADRKLGLMDCLWYADYHKEEFLKLNGTFNAKTGIIRAPIPTFQIADARRAADINQCQIQYGVR